MLVAVVGVVERKRSWGGVKGLREGLTRGVVVVVVVVMVVVVVVLVVAVEEQ